MNEDEILEAIEIEYLYLKQLWEEYKNIFSSKENIDAINKYCGGCFHLIQVALNNEIIIVLNRILDTEGTGKNKNLVLESLAEKIKSDEGVFRTMINDIRDILKHCKLKEVRNKRLAHSDKKEKEKDGTYFLIASYDCIEEILSGIESTLKYYREKNSLEPMAYEQSSLPPGCDCLINAIKNFNSEQSRMINPVKEPDLFNPDNLSFIELMRLILKKLKFWR